MSFFQFEKTTLNANGLKWYAIIAIATFIIGIFIPVMVHKAIHFGIEAVLFVLTAGVFYIAGTTSFENNDSWKSFFAFFVLAANLVAPTIFLNA